MEPAQAPSSGLSDANEDPYDYGADADPDSKVVAQAFADLDRLTLAAERATAARKRAEDQLDKCTTSSGIEVTIKRDIKASLPGHERVEARLGALRWLTEHGHGAVIKNQVFITLERGEDSRADDLVVELRSRGFVAEAKKDVNPQTLGALAREVMGEGKIVPRDRFNLFDFKTAKLSRK